MAHKLKLKIGLDRYDRHFPFFDGTAPTPENVELVVDQIGQSARLRDGADRHGAMLEGMYDVAEFSMSSFLIAREKGIAITGIPIFPRRLFSQSQMWVHPDSSFWHPRDLIGKKVALSAFQTTLSLLARGDLKSYYNVEWESIHWLLTSEEKVAFKIKPGVKVDFIGNRQGLGQSLENGEIDAFFLPHPPHSVSTGQTRARRLFADPKGEELAYFNKVGDYPIMHVIVLRQELADAYPWLCMALYKMFNDANAIAESYYEDPNWSRLAWGLHALEDERRAFGRDPWENGFKRNHRNVERFIAYSHDQGLIGQTYPAERLFDPSTHDT
jgi:4,5-dihydroxyphthalate decarboxylase